MQTSYVPVSFVELSRQAQDRTAVWIHSNIKEQADDHARLARRRPKAAAQASTANPTVPGSGTDEPPDAPATNAVGDATVAVSCAPWLLNALSISV